MAIYFIRAVESNRVKIGYTAGNPHKRLRAMQTGCPEKLKVEFFFREAGPDQESYFHDMFKEQRVRGEWFRFHPEISASLAKWKEVEWKLICYDLRKQGVNLCL